MTSPEVPAVSPRDGGDLFDLAGRLAGEVGAPITIEDPQTVVLAYSVGSQDVDEARVGTILGRRIPDRYRTALAEAGVFDRLFELGMRAAVERGLPEVAMPFLQDLYERTHEMVHLGVLDGHEVVYVAKTGGHWQARSPSRTGGRMPLHCTAIGKALLAHGDAELRRSVLESPLPRRTPRTVVAPGLLAGQLVAVIETGVAFAREESTTGLLCVASAVLDVDGRSAVAAISVTGPVGRFRPEAHVSSVKAAAPGLGSVLARRSGEAAHPA